MKISIGLPVYNAEDYLSDTILSILNQSYSDFELIIIDDGSSDRSFEIASSFDDERIRLIRDGKNKKLATRLNQIVSEAKHDIIARCDADDLMHPLRLEKQVSYFSDEKIDLVSSGMYVINSSKKITGCRLNASPDFNIKNMLSKGSPICHPTIMGRKKFFLEYPYSLTNHRTEDLELWCRLSSENAISNKNFRLIDDYLYYYLDEGAPHPNQTNKSINERLELCDRFIDRFEERVLVKVRLYSKRLILTNRLLSSMYDLVRKAHQKNGNFSQETIILKDTIESYYEKNI